MSTRDSFFLATVNTIEKKYSASHDGFKVPYELLDMKNVTIEKEKHIRLLSMETPAI